MPGRESPGPSRAPAPPLTPAPAPATPDEAQERLAAIGRVAAGVAHDLNNVLTVVTLCTELLGAQSGLDDAGREQLGHIRRETERGASMVWQILDFAQRGPVARTAVDLDVFFAELLPVLRHTQAPGAAVTFRTDGAPHWVMGEAARLEQIVSNLVTNASDAIAGDGGIGIALETPVVEAGATAGWVRITVSDTGAGIPPEVLPRIFEPFFSTKPHGHGTGLGLAQVQALVSQHDGRVRVASVPGAGTTVEVWLPAAIGAGASGNGAGHDHVGADAGDLELVALDV